MNALPFPHHCVHTGTLDTHSQLTATWSSAAHDSSFLTHFDARRWVSYMQATRGWNAKSAVPDKLSSGRTSPRTSPT